MIDLDKGQRATMNNRLFIHLRSPNPNCDREKKRKEGKNQSGQISPQNNAESEREADTARFIDPWIPPGRRLSSPLLILLLTTISHFFCPMPSSLLIVHFSSCVEG
eukprot:scaffold3967_cov126-Skeletonema_dohrnii-CCMP3373.AAC.9